MASQSTSFHPSAADSERMHQSSLWPGGKIDGGPVQRAAEAMGEAGCHVLPRPLSPCAPCCPVWQHFLTGLSGGGGSGERDQRSSPCRTRGWDPRGLGQRLSSDAILWRGRRGPPLPNAMASLHVLCSLPCLRISVDLWPLRSSPTAAQLLARTPALLRALAPGRPGREVFGERSKPPMQ